MGYWTKHFLNGSKETGTDRAINNKEASWSRGKLESIQEVVLSDHLIIATLFVPNTSWYQYDRYEFYSGTGETKRVARIIQAEITSDHLGLFFACVKNHLGMYYASLEDFVIEDSIFCKEILDKDIGLWATIKLRHNNLPLVTIDGKGKAI